MKSVSNILTDPITFIKCQLGLALRLLPDKPYVRVQYYLKTKKILHLSHPKTFTEKLQWTKIYGRLERYAKYVDKYDVREFVEETVGASYLIPIHGVWDRFEDIDFDKLPNKFVLKSTHGYNHNFICKDKSAIDFAALEKRVDKWMNESIYTIGRSPQYKFIKPRLICEEYMEDASGALVDYKFACFGGEPHMIQILTDRASDITEDYFDTEWNLLPVTEAGYPNAAKTMPRPNQLGKLLAVANKLSQGFPFVRVDLYLVNDKVYFGELTFTPANGMITYDPASTDYELGKLIDLSMYQTSGN